VTATRPMAKAFPAPSPIVVGALDELRLAAVSPPESASDLRRLATLPRPWDAPTCPTELRRLIYAWLDEVAVWINEEHTWRIERVIPICLSRPSPHSSRSRDRCLPALGNRTRRKRRGAGGLAPIHPSPVPRTSRAAPRTDRLPPGRHQPHPGDARNGLYRGEPEATQRRQRWASETADG